MQDWDSLITAIITLLIAIFFLVLEFTELVIQRDEPVTTTASILFCRTERIKRPRRRTKEYIYFHINKPPYKIQYSDPDEYEEAFLQRCDLRDKMKFTYYRKYSGITNNETYWLIGMESLTDGQIILSLDDVTPDQLWCLVLPMVMALLCASLFYFKKWLTHKPDLQEIERQESLKNKFEMDKKEAIKALRSNPQDIRACLLLGWMMSEDKRPEQARECYERALKISLQSHETGELSAETWPTWLDLVATEQDVPLILEDSYASPPTNSIPLPNWLDKEERRFSFFSHLRRLLLSPIELVFSLFIISPFCWILSRLFFREGLLALFLEYSVPATMSLVSLTMIIEVIKMLQVSRGSRHWPESSAIVIGSFFRRTTSKGKHSYHLYVVCAYQVNDSIYYSTVPSQKASFAFGSVYQSWRNESEHYLQQKEKEFSFPKPMTLFYNPDQPDMMLHQVGFNKDAVESLIVVLVMALLFGFLSGIFWYPLLN